MKLIKITLLLLSAISLINLLWLFHLQGKFNQKDSSPSNNTLDVPVIRTKFLDVVDSNNSPRVSFFTSGKETSIVFYKWNGEVRYSFHDNGYALDPMELTLLSGIDLICPYHGCSGSDMIKSKYTEYPP